MTCGRCYDKASRRRREFLKICGKFAAVTPPAIALLLSTSSRPIARSGAAPAGPHRNNGYGNGGADGSPKAKRMQRG
ncbi:MULTISPECIES: hypothetical protein [unclassified Bradyrhizobium]|uniref:hypothetical protein n=1 Tax=unclassified Bradyrhizobium TaxID=2631580 RepID=UPI001FF84170|nr:MULTISPECIES: hypothetical protein [unclassified Bradyrhizobium]